ncbi:hypothetical protein Tco_1175099 [Tanacetum coccineum]
MIDQGVTAALAARDAIRSTNGEDSHNSGMGVRRNERATRECTYPDFMKCQPLNFKGTEGVVELTQCIKKMEIYCPRTKIKKLEVKLWDLEVKESDKIKRYVGGLPDMIHGSVVASKPKTMQEATEIATELMYKRIRTFAERQRENKRKQDDNQQQQQQNKRRTPVGCTLQGLVRRSHTGDLNPYALNATITTMVHVLPNATSAIELAIWPATVGVLQILMLVTIRGARGQNRNHENQDEGTEARGIVYALGGGETDQDPNSIEDEIET